MGTHYSPFPYGRPKEPLDVDRFRSDQQASIRRKGYDQQELLAVLSSSLRDNRFNLMRFEGAASEADFTTIAVRSDDLHNSFEVYRDLASEIEGGAEQSDWQPDLEFLIELLIESREIQVIMNRAQGNYHIPNDSPPPVHPPPASRSSDNRGVIWAGAAILAILGLVLGQVPLLLAAFIVFIYGLGHHAGSKS